MITPELVSFIKGSLEKGTSLTTVKHDLLGAGWTDDDINEALVKLDISSIATPPVQTPAPKPAPAIVVTPLSTPISTTPSTPTSAPAYAPISTPNFSPAPVLAQAPANLPVDDEGAGELAHALNTAPVQVAPATTHEAPAVAHKKSYMGYILLILVLLLGGGVIYAYLGRIGPFAQVGSYTEANFMSGILTKFGDVNTSDYAVALSLNIEPRDADAVPFALEPLGEDYAAKYKNDYTRAQNVQSILSNLRYKDKYPATLEQLKSTDGTTYNFYDTSLSFTDPATKEKYYYALTNAGKDFILIVKFETKEAVTQIKSSYDFKAETTAIEGQTVTFTKDSPSYVYISSEPPKPLLMQWGDMSSYLPAEFEAALTLSAQADWQKENLADWAFNVDAYGDFGDLSYKINIDALKKDEDYYLKINNIPSLILGSYSNLKGQWIKIPSKTDDAKAADGSTVSYPSYDPLSSITRTFSEGEADYKQNRIEGMALLKKAAQFADEEKLIGFKTKPVKETINGRELSRYDLRLNRDAIVPFYKKLQEEASKSEKFHPIFEDASLLEYLQSDEFQTTFDYYEKNTWNSVWVDQDGFPAIIKSTSRIVPPDSADQLVDKQGKLEITFSLSEINQPINIEAPEDATNLEDLPAYKSAQAANANASIKSNLANMRAQAELFFDKSQSYGITATSCAPTVGSLFGDKDIVALIKNVRSSMEDAKVKGAVVNCYSKSTAYAVSAKLVETEKEGGYWCIDSTGFAKAVTKPVSSTACPK